MDPHDLQTYLNGITSGMILLIVLERIAFPFAIRIAHVTRSRRDRR